MRHITLFAATLAALLALAAPARADMVDDCEQSRDQDLSIGGCTAVIRSGEWQGKELSWAYYNRANAYRRLGEHRRSIEDFDQALRLDPGDGEAYNNRGNAYYDLGEHRRAIEDFDQALRLNPGDGDASYNRGNAYRKLGEYARAIEDYDQVLRLDPGDASAYQNRGASYNYLGDHERAVVDWEQAIRIDGAPRAKRWQKYLKGKGHYSGAIDGIFGTATRRALLACAIDPAC